MAKYASTGVTSTELNLLDDFSGTIASSLPKATTSELGFLKTGGSNLSIGSETVTYTVTIVNVSGSNVFALDGVNNPRLTMVEGSTYNFSNPSYSSHPISFVNASTGASYTDGVTDNQSSTGVITIVVPSGAPQLRYRCTTHGNGMGNLIDITDINPLNKTDTTYTDATTSAPGLMLSSDKLKLDGIADNANNYVLPAATSSALGGAKINSSSGLTEVDGEFSVVSTFKAVYTDSVQHTQHSTPSGYTNHGKFAGYGQWSQALSHGWGSMTRMQYPTIASDGSYSSFSQLPNTTQFLNTDWRGSWGIWNSYGYTSSSQGYTAYYDANSNNNKGGGVEISVPSGFSTSDKIFLYFSAPMCGYNPNHTPTSFSPHINGEHIGGFRWQSGTDRWYDPYHGWGATGDWSNHGSGTTYVGGTIGEEFNILPSTYAEASGTTNQNKFVINYHTVANIPTSSAFKIRPWFRLGSTNNSFGVAGQGALWPVSSGMGQIRITAIITS